LERTIQTGKKPDEAEVKRLAKNLIEQIDSLTGIANAFSDFARMPKSKKEKVNLVEVIDNSLSLFDKFQHISLNFKNSASNSAYVLSDRDQLLRVMNNLLKNAIQATSETSDPVIDITLSTQGEYYQISVSDNGPGIDENVQDRIFVPNFTTKTRGMGLGLAISKNIIEQFGGEIWFETSEGRGTSFHFKLPALK
jgi:signal transduction histidine kinase